MRLIYVTIVTSTRYISYFLLSVSFGHSARHLYYDLLINNECNYLLSINNTIIHSQFMQLYTLNRAYTNFLSINNTSTPRTVLSAPESLLDCIPN